MKERNMVKLRRWFWAWDLDSEKEFLEGKAKEGLILVDTKVGNYCFEEEEPKDLVYEMDFRIGTAKISEEEYLKIYKEAGWTLAANFFGWYYFYCEREEEADHTIFNDNASKSGIYRRLLWFLCITGFPIYYQILILFPTLRQMEHSTFYYAMQIIMSIIMVLHASALIRIAFEYRKLRKGIKE